MKKVLIAIVLLPYIIIESIFTVIFGRGFGSYRYHNTLLEIYEKIGFERYISNIANYEEDSGRCIRFYSIAKKSYLDK